MDNDTSPNRSDAMPVDVNKCQRCGKDHSQLLFYPLANPADLYKWWSICPVTQQPLMVKVTEQDPDWHRKEPLQRLAVDIEAAICEALRREPFSFDTIANPSRGTSIERVEQTKAKVVAAIHEQLRLFFAK